MTAAPSTMHWHNRNAGTRLWSICIIGFLPVILWSQTGNSVDSSLAAVRSLYDDGKYSACEIESRRLLERQELPDSVRILVEQHLAFTLVAQEQHDAAVEHFTAILRLAPSFDLDPVLTSPKIVTVFNEARLKFLSRQQRAAGGPPSAVTLPSSGPTWRTLVFPGWEQLHQGRTVAGISFVAVGAAALVATVSCDIQRREKHKLYLSAGTSALAASRYDDYNKYYKAEIYSAVGFIAVYLASQVDILLLSRERYSVAVQPESTSLSFRVHF